MTPFEMPKRMYVTQVSADRGGLGHGAAAEHGELVPPAGHVPLLPEAGDLLPEPPR